MRRSFRRKPRSSRRKKDWQSNSNYSALEGDIPAGTLLIDSQWVAFPADTFGEVSGVNDQIEQEEDNTIVRSLNWGAISFVPSASASAGVTFHGMGLIRWENNTQDSPNPLRIPNPVIDADADWLWLWTGGTQMVGVSGGQQQVRTSLELGLDHLFQSKASRKLTSKQGLLMIACVDNSFGTVTLSRFEWSFLSRFLVLLP